MVCNLEVETLQRYRNLKDKVFEAIGSKYNLEDIKKYFENDIDSPRALSHTKNLREIINLLEQRDVLNSHQVKPLLYLGQFLNNEDVIEVSAFYLKFYEVTLCSKCRIKISYAKPTLPLKPHKDVSRPYSNSTNSNSTDLKEAIKNISRQIGKQWPKLASELNILESQIDVVYKKHPKETELQASEALTFWLINDKENATIEVLDKALNARLCQRVGIGSHLRELPAGISSIQCM